MRVLDEEQRVGDRRRAGAPRPARAGSRPDLAVTRRVPRSMIACLQRSFNGSEMWIASPSARLRRLHDRLGQGRVRRGWSGARSSATAPISIASAASAIRSTAPLPTMCTPSTSSVSASTMTFTKPSVSLTIARPERGERELADLDLAARLFGLVLGEAGRRDLRIGEDDGGDGAHVELGLVAGDDLGDDLGLLGRLVREHRLPGDVADRVDAGHVGAQLLVDGDEAALSILTPTSSRPRSSVLGRRPTDDQDLVGVDRAPLAVLGSTVTTARSPLSLPALGLGVGQDLDAHLLELARDDLDAVLVHAGQDAGSASTTVTLVPSLA